MKNFQPTVLHSVLTEQCTPKMRYDGNVSFNEWQHTAEDKLRQLLGMATFQKCDDQMNIEYDVERAPLNGIAFREIRFTFQSEEGYFVPCHLLIPMNAKEKLPVALCVQGHSTGMHISLGRSKFDPDEPTLQDGSRLFALQAIANGFCALTIEQRNFGECGGTNRGPNCHLASTAALLIGRTTIGERVWDISRSIDVLENHFSEHIDFSNIICVGNSAGGTATFYASCLEKRISISVPSCAVCSFDDSIMAMDHCICNFIPNIRPFFDMGDLAGLIAPRKLITVCGNQDPIFPLKGVVKSFETTKTLYAAAGAANHCTLVIGEGKHRFYPEDTWQVVQSNLN